MFKGVTPVEDTASTPFTGVIAVEEAPAPAVGPQPKVLSQAGQSYRLAGADKTKAPEWYEELAGGLKHSLDSSALGLEKSVKWAANKLPGVNWEVDPENVANVERGREFEKGTSGWSTAGKVGGDIAQGLAVGGVGGLAGAGRVLPLAADVAAQTGWGALTAPEDKASAAAWGGGGAAFGAALPAAVAGVKKVGEVASDYAVPGRSATRQLTKHLGADEFAKAGEKVKQGLAAGDSILPQTTAAMTDNVKLGGLESGARSRGKVDFSAHDAAVDAAKKAKLMDITKGADEAGSLTQELGSVTAETERRLGNMPLGKGRKEAVVDALEGLKTNQKVLGDDETLAVLEKSIAKIKDPNSNTLMLKVLSDKMPKDSKFDPIRGVLDEAAAERSKNISSTSGALVGDIQEKLGAARASKSLRGEYFDQGRKLKDINELTLNRSLTRPGLDSDVVEQGAKLSDELRRSKLYETSTAPKSIPKSGIIPDAKSLTGIILAVKSGGWSLAANLAGDFADKIARDHLDEALKDPVKFYKMIQNKEARGVALEAWEKNVDKALRAGAHVGGVAGRQIGEENAP